MFSIFVPFKKVPKPINLMKKSVLISLLSIAALFLIVFSSWFIWYIKPYKSLKVYILDKTVPTTERQEHRSFNWILNHDKYVRKDGNLYNVNDDYFGFFPKNTGSAEFDFKSIRIHEIEDYALNYDMCYYTDTYGVYYNEWYRQNSFEEQHISNKVYGGLNQNDYLFLKEMKNHKKLIITEFNFYNAPTNSLIREKLEDLFGLKWSGWTGRYFPSMDTIREVNFPKWIVRLYKEQNNNTWPFKNGGIVLIHKFGTVAILENQTHLLKEWPVIQSSKETVEEFGVVESIEYLNWFDITFTSDTNKVLANFHFNVNEKGDSLLHSYNLQSIFPAVIEHTNDYLFYYFGGDFADNPVKLGSSYFFGYNQIASSFSSIRKNNPKEFYWNYYYPLMSKILDDYYNTLEK
jgi:hypothetical protein